MRYEEISTCGYAKLQAKRAHLYIFSIGAIVLVKQNNAVMFNVAKTLKQGQGRCRM